MNAKLHADKTFCWHGQTFTSFIVSLDDTHHSSDDEDDDKSKGGKEDDENDVVGGEQGGGGEQVSVYVSHLVYVLLFSVLCDIVCCM